MRPCDDVQRSASIGLRVSALDAGQEPKNAPKMARATDETVAARKVRPGMADENLVVWVLAIVLSGRKLQAGQDQGQVPKGPRRGRGYSG